MSGENKPYAQLQTLWSERVMGTPPAVKPPLGCALRTCQPGLELTFSQTR